MTKVEILKLQKKVASKMMAAIAMLLVASVMMVGVTYAWMTLSTAPESREIATTAGANGSLEIALQSGAMSQSTGQVERSEPGSGRGASSALEANSVRDANVNWGNIIDIDTSYGLNKVVMTPSRLNLESGTNNVNTGNILRIPVYGKDGRIMDMTNVPSTYFDPAAGTSGMFVTGKNYGVNVIGYQNVLNNPSSASAYTMVTTYDRQAIVNEMAAQVGADRMSLKNRVVNLVKTDTVTNVNHPNILGRSYSAVITRMLYELSRMQGFTQNTADGLSDMLNDMSLIVNDAVASLKYAFMAYAAADTKNFPDTEAGRTALSDLYSVYEGYGAQQIAEAATQYTSQNSTYQDIIDAANAIANVQTSISGARDKLSDTSTMLYGILEIIDALPADKTMSVNDTDPITGLQQVQQSNEGYMYLWKGNGVFSAMASIVGDFTTLVASDPLELTMYCTGEDATIATAPAVYNESENTGILGTIYDSSAGKRVSGTISKIQTFDASVTGYGYSIDMAFRSNASGNLILQSSALDRVTGAAASGGATAGAGSTVIFDMAAELGADQIAGLLDSLRVVFMDTSSGRIWAVATADTASGSYTVAGTRVTTNLSLYSPRFESGILKLGNSASGNTIRPLIADTPAYVTAVVYLDGDAASSSTLAAETVMSLVGTINLQFAYSGAEQLVPYSGAAFATDSTGD